MITTTLGLGVPGCLVLKQACVSILFQIFVVFSGCVMLWLWNSGARGLLLQGSWMALGVCGKWLAGGVFALLSVLNSSYSLSLSGRWLVVVVSGKWMAGGVWLLVSNVRTECCNY